MRQSNRTTILNAAVEVIEAEGITAVTFDSIAAASGITRGGIIYHFRSREDLIGAIHQHLARRWEEQLEAACGKPADQATTTERLIAYIRVTATSATRAELQMLIDSSNSEHKGTWAAVLDRWTPQRDSLGDTQGTKTHMIALLAADGLWVNEAISSNHIQRSDRIETAERIVELLHTTRPSSP
ncbi:TetR/AcrR family transcriptional regulator [Brevibacterium luteolum]|uniref:TetR/AcrR family transcriptional regulator n=1 Tax=Brevibacterium luteolum TaxID=199591 RepID=A0A2N6PJZ3_9MICO|nr:TetR/AcrR family transcriptional regulator [Brevibacterium luteolum]